MIDKENKQILSKHGCYYIRVHPCSLQLISNNIVDIPESFEKIKMQMVIIKILMKKELKRTAASLVVLKVGFTPVVERDTESQLVNENDYVSTLTDSLNGLTIK